MTVHDDYKPGQRATLSLSVDTLLTTVDALCRDIAQHRPGTEDLDRLVVTYGRAILEHRMFIAMACGCYLHEVVRAGGGLGGHRECDILRLARKSHAQRFGGVPSDVVGELDAEMRLAYDRAIAGSDAESIILPPFSSTGIDPNISTVAWAGGNCRQCSLWGDLIPVNGRGSHAAESTWISEHNRRTDHHGYWRWSIIRSTATPDPRLDDEP